MKREQHWRFQEEDRTRYNEVDADAIISGIYTILTIIVIFGGLSLVVG